MPTKTELRVASVSRALPFTLLSLSSGLLKIRFADLNELLIQIDRDQVEVRLPAVFSLP